MGLNREFEGERCREMQGEGMGSIMRLSTLGVRQAMQSDRQKPQSCRGRGSVCDATCHDCHSGQLPGLLAGIIPDVAVSVLVLVLVQTDTSTACYAIMKA